MKVLITGGTGALGRSLKKVFPDAICPTHEEMDIVNKSTVKEKILEIKPDVLIHTAAMVGIRECEEQKDTAHTVNVDGVKNIVEALKELNNDCYLVYMSTACVFGGEQEKYYTEEDEPDPKNYYSKTKLEGESVVKNYPNTVIIRTNFVAKEPWKYPKAFTDRFGTYLFADGVAQGIKDVVEAKEKGIIHIVGDRRMSMYELAKLSGSDVGEMTLDEYDGPPVTVDMSLSTKRWKKYTIS